jgi:hypothetical protein
MSEWCFAHPLLTFWLLFFLLAVVDNAIANLANRE